jgi:hypothetical protein
MSPENVLLHALLDSFDRLHDRECGPADTHALLKATAIALPESATAPMIREAEAQLVTVLRSGAPRDQQLADALEAIDALRHHLADVLY